MSDDDWGGMDDGDGAPMDDNEWGGADGDEFDQDAGAGQGGASNSDGVTKADELTHDIQIANIFYEAEDLLRDNQQLALQKFRQVIELSTQHSSDINEESKSSSFTSLVHIVMLSYQLGDTVTMKKEYETLLTLIPKVTRNEGSESIDKILNVVSNSQDFSFLSSIYTLTCKTLQGVSDTERMIFNIKLKLCKTLVDKGDYKEAQKVLNELHSSCLTKDGQDDKKNRGGELLEIYALEIKLSFIHNDKNNMKNLFEKTKDLTAAVKDPRSQSIIRECWGQMFGDDGQWSRAYTEFYSAFTHYMEIGNREKAKDCLKYVVVSNMLSGGEQNPFDAREAKVYQNESDIAAIVNLRSAYEKCDVNGFNTSLGEINKANDKFINTHLDSMVEDFLGRAILQITKSYKRILLSSLAESLKISQSKVESLLVSLILNGDLTGKIDQCKGILDLTGSSGGNQKKFNSIQSFTATLQNLQQQILHTQINI